MLGERKRRTNGDDKGVGPVAGARPWPASGRRRTMLPVGVFAATWGVLWLMERGTGGLAAGNATIAVCVVALLAHLALRRKAERTSGHMLDDVPS